MFPLDILKGFVKNYSLLLFTDNKQIGFVDVFRNSFFRFLSSLKEFHEAKIDIGMSRLEVPDFVLGFLAKLKFSLSLLRSSQSISPAHSNSGTLIAKISSYFIRKEEIDCSIYSPVNDISSLENIQNLLVSIFEVNSSGLFFRLETVCR